MVSSKGWYTYEVHLEMGWGEGVRRKWDIIRRRRGGGVLASVLDVWTFVLLKKIGFAPWPDIMLSQTLSHPLMIPLHFLWTKSNSRTRGQFECDVTWGFFFVCFCFDFVHLHARCDCCSIVCLHFQVVQIKQVDCRIRTKNVSALFFI